MTRGVFTREPHVIVIGGGITGLAAAERLALRVPGVRITVLEASDRLGGTIRTTRESGYVIESGPDSFLASKPAAAELCARVGIADSLHGTAPGIHGSYVMRKGRLQRLPAGLSGLVPSRLWPFLESPVLSWRGKLRVGAEMFISAAAPHDVSIEAFIVRRLGREMYDRIVEPLLTGIYAGDGARLSIDATFPQLKSVDATHGGMIRGMLATRRRAGTAPAFLSLCGGLGQLVDALERKLSRTDRVTVRRDAPALRIERPSGGATVVVLASGERHSADAVLVCTPARIAAHLLAGILPVAAAELRAIEYSSTAVVTLAYSTASIRRPFDATGYTVPRIEGRAALACTWSSAKFRGRAPAGKSLVRVFIGGARRPDLVTRDDAALVEIARDEVHDTLGVAVPPELERVDRWLDAMPQYNVGHPARVARIDELIGGERWLGLAGNSYRGVGIPDCITSGQRAADLVLARMAASEVPSVAGNVA